MPTLTKVTKVDPLSPAGILQEMVPDSTYRAVTPHNTTNIGKGQARALYIGGAGDVTCINGAGDAILFKSVPAGFILPVATTRVNSTGTTATYIVAL